MHLTSRLRPARPVVSTILFVIVAFGLVATSCAGDDANDAAAIATNEGGVLVRPPDVLEGDPAPTTEAGAEAADEGLTTTPVVGFTWFDGTQGSTADFAGRPTVLNFWASNCAPCVAEMPDFEEANQALAGQVQFVGMNVADERSAAVELAAQTGVTYPLADDSASEVFRALGGFVMPTTALLNARGQVAYVWSGVLTNEELRILIDRHILPGSNDDV